MNEIAVNAVCLEGSPSNKPLEWTGRRRICLDSNRFLPATQGQRYAAQPKATNNRKDTTRIPPTPLSLCGLDRLLYNSHKDKLGRSS